MLDNCSGQTAVMREIKGRPASVFKSVPRRGNVRIRSRNERKTKNEKRKKDEKKGEKRERKRNAKRRVVETCSSASAASRLRSATRLKRSISYGGGSIMGNL